jgi:hypothetical protein
MGQTSRSNLSRVLAFGFDKTQPICNCKRMTQDWSDLEDQIADMTLAEFSRTMPAAFREMMRRFIPLISAALERQPDNADKWGVAFAVGASFCAGRSMADIAAKLGCSRALLSYKARQFCEDCSLPPSGYMKSEDAVETAKSARNDAVCRTKLKKGINQ